MWPLWGLDLNRVRCDLLFTEAINQRMQVPNRLKVAESCSPGDRRTGTEDVPASFRMHIPDRISLAEISDTSLRPVVLTQPRKVPSVVVHVSPDPSGDVPFLPSASRASAQRRKRSGHHSTRSRRDRTMSDCAQLALHNPGQQHEGSQEPIPAAESALEEAGMTEVAVMRRQERTFMCVDPSSSCPKGLGGHSQAPLEAVRGAQMLSDGKNIFLKHLLQT
ncbi:mitochondrial fission factor homolog B-like isoform 3-T6 [Acridotheres tristis]